ncbi:MAG: hypothetical protein LBK44_00420 [Spirochaetales bacterium]|nr:hypothetical protein [Spirochaetales bacterium]
MHILWAFRYNPLRARQRLSALRATLFRIPLGVVSRLRRVKSKAPALHLSAATPCVSLFRV